MKKVRASMGTLGVLGLEFILMDTPPTTAYLQIYTEKRCKANCQFCAQAQGSNADINRIARGMYMPVDLEAVVGRLNQAYLRGYLGRACIQTALYDDWWEDTIYLIRRIHEESDIPISLSVFPLSNENYKVLKGLGITGLVIPIDACTPELFDTIKGKSAGGPYSWESHIDGIKRASQVFDKVGTHLMIGLGESDEDAIWLIEDLAKTGVNPALFSYIYIPGSQLSGNGQNEEKSIRHYRTVQLSRYLIMEKLADFQDFRFKDGVLIDFGVAHDLILEVIKNGTAFQTSGCPDCNRPMANETFSKIYNFPEKPNEDEIKGIMKDLGWNMG